jgi:phage tail protein X
VDTESSEVRDQVEQARARLGDTVEALAHRLKAPTGGRVGATVAAAVAGTLAAAVTARRAWNRTGLDVAGPAVVRPAVRGTMRARQARKEGHEVRLHHVASYVAVAIFLTWLAKTLEALIDRWGDPAED